MSADQNIRSLDISKTIDTDITIRSLTDEFCSTC
uniref:Uncharacterized protein n=1 Tax=Arundo donax TaxID=35708 RepID=A0A0A9FH70_ARUDO